MINRYRGFTTVNISGPNMRKVFVLLLLGTALIFAIAGGFAMIQAESDIHSTNWNKYTSKISPMSLVSVMGGEVPFLTDSVQAPSTQDKVSKLIFELLTSIDLKDPRTYLGSELPMFALFDTDILVASEGVNFTDIPIESPPPTDLDKEIQKAIAESGGNTEKPITYSSKKGSKVKKILIYNTHFWESYIPELNSRNPERPNKNDASDLKVNVAMLSKYLNNQLEKLGVGAETTYKVYPWKNAYGSSRRLVVAALKENKNLTYLVDIHRDSLPKDKTTITINGKPYARILFIVGRASDNFQKNYELATELHNAMNKLHPGLSKGVFAKPRDFKNNGEYNQSLSPNSMLVEVGGTGNTFAEGYRSLDVLAKVLSEKINNATPVSGQSARP